MRHIKPNSTPSLRPVAILLALMASVVIFIGCEKEQQTNVGTAGNTGNTGTPPLPTPSPEPPRNLGDTPIVISGGSTEIDFDHDVFRSISSTKFSSTNAGAFASVTVHDDSESAEDDDYIKFVVPGSGKLTVKLTYQDKSITISNESNGKVEAEFDTSALKTRPTPGKARKHYNRRIKLTGIEVKSAGSAVVCQDFQGNPMPPAQCRLPGNKFMVAIGFK